MFLFDERTAFPEDSKYPMPFGCLFLVIIQKNKKIKNNLKTNENQISAISLVLYRTSFTLKASPK